MSLHRLWFSRTVLITAGFNYEARPAMRIRREEVAKATSVAPTAVITAVELQEWGTPDVSAELEALKKVLARAGVWAPQDLQNACVEQCPGGFAQRPEGVEGAVGGWNFPFGEARMLLMLCRDAADAWYITLFVHGSIPTDDIRPVLRQLCYGLRRHLNKPYETTHGEDVLNG